jgi:hypothetical protein
MLQFLVLAAALLAQGEKTPPPAEPVVVKAAPLPPISASAQILLDRLTSHFAPLPGVKVTAKHRIEAPNKRILNENTREIVIIKPNKIKVTQDGMPFLVCDGTDAWMVPQQGVTFDTLKAPPTLPDCITEFRALGNGGIAGSGGLVAALLSPNAISELLKEVDALSVIQKGDDDLLILQIGPHSKRLRKGLRLGIFIPRDGDPWPSQMDVIPPAATVFTRIAFSDWSVSGALPTSFDKPVITGPSGTFNPGVPKSKSNAKPADVAPAKKKPAGS